jgi:hypothetical protein
MAPKLMPLSAAAAGSSRSSSRRGRIAKRVEPPADAATADITASRYSGHTVSMPVHARTASATVDDHPMTAVTMRIVRRSNASLSMPA